MEMALKTNQRRPKETREDQRVLELGSLRKTYSLVSNRETLGNRGEIVEKAYHM